MKTRFHIDSGGIIYNERSILSGLRAYKIVGSWTETIEMPKPSGSCARLALCIRAQLDIRYKLSTELCNWFLWPVIMWQCLLPTSRTRSSPPSLVVSSVSCFGGWGTCVHAGRERGGMIRELSSFRLAVCVCVCVLLLARPVCVHIFPLYLSSFESMASFMLYI